MRCSVWYGFKRITPCYGWRKPILKRWPTFHDVTNTAVDSSRSSLQRIVRWRMHCGRTESVKLVPLLNLREYKRSEHNPGSVNILLEKICKNMKEGRAELLIASYNEFTNSYRAGWNSLYSGGARLKPRPERRHFWQRCLVAFLSPSGQILGWELNQAKIESFHIFFCSSYFGLCVVLTAITPKTTLLPTNRAM